MHTELMKKRSLSEVETENGEYEIFENVVLVGDSGVGKSSLLHKYFTKKVEVNEPTQVADYYHKQAYAGNFVVHFNIFDTSGQHLNAPLAMNFLKNETTTLLLVFDLTNFESFKAIQEFWMVEVEKRCEDLGINLPTIVLVGNKGDQTRHRMFEDGAIERFLRAKKILYHEASAMQTSTRDVKLIFDTLTSLTIQKNNTQGRQFGTMVARPETKSLRLSTRRSMGKTPEGSTCC